MRTFRQIKEQMQEKRDRQNNVRQAIRDYGRDNLRTYIAIDYYRGSYPKDVKFIQQVMKEMN